MNRTDFSYINEPERSRCEELQTKMFELLPTRQWRGDELWSAAAAALGNEDERYCLIYVCQQCGDIYHGDYSSNSDPDRDFCGAECEIAFFHQHPEEIYNGEFQPNPAEGEAK